MQSSSGKSYRGLDLPPHLKALAEKSPQDIRIDQLEKRLKQCEDKLKQCEEKNSTGFFSKVRKTFSFNQSKKRRSKNRRRR